MDSAASLLEAYRRDRRRLLGFLLSAGAGGHGRAADLSRVDLDAVSADYALDCVASGKARASPSLRARAHGPCARVRAEVEPFIYELNYSDGFRCVCVSTFNQTRRAV
jgi:hypothetical protein